MFVRCVVLLGLLGAGACVRNVDVSKIKCVDGSSCPKNYTCSPIPGKGYGTCVAGNPSLDGGQADHIGPDGQVRTEGGAIDGLRAEGGHSGSMTGQGGAGGTTDTSLTAGAMGGVLSGGTTSTGGASTAGTTSPRDGGVDAPGLLSDGSPCSAGTMCASGQCVDGVCCESKCDGQCQACNEKNSVGRCVAVSGDPRGTRTACTGTAPCKGQCDGTATEACTFPGSSKVCTAASCKDGSATPASVCNSAGACTTVTAAPCSSNLCASDGSKCSGSCTASSCGTGYYCNTAGSCTKKADPGAPCGNKDECASGFCVDGFCCNSECTGQCQACGATGTCARVTGAPRSGRAPCKATDAICAGTCDGTSDTCVYKDTTTVCAAAICADATTLNNKTTCNGAGACTAVGQTNCGSSGQYCSTNQCAAKVTDGNPCTSNAQCANGNCSDSICCGTGQTSCSGTCTDLKTNRSNCGVCGRACPAGQSCCGGTCTDLNNSNSNCGSCGHSCGAQVCSTGICCDAGNTTCGGTCCDTNHTCSGSTCSCQGYSMSCGGCGAWNFESNATEGWIKMPTSLVAAASCNAVKSITVVNDRADQGTHSLAIRVDSNVSCPSGSGTVVADFAVPLCPSGASFTVPADLNVYADFYFVSDSGVSIPDFAIFGAGFYGPGDQQSFADSTWGVTVPSTPWATFHGQLTTAVTASHLGFTWIPNNWSGTIYIDKIRITP